MHNSPTNNEREKRTRSLWKSNKIADQSDITVPVHLAYCGIAAALRYYVIQRTSNLAILLVESPDALESYVAAGRLYLRQVSSRKGYLDPFVRAVKKGRMAGHRNKTYSGKQRKPEMAYCFARVWTTADIPLDEVAERYRVEIVSDGVVQRAIEVSEAACLYAASDEVADFGSPQTTLAIRVRQLGRAVPLGIAASAVLSV